MNKLKAALLKKAVINTMTKSPVLKNQARIKDALKKYDAVSKVAQNSGHDKGANDIAQIKLNKSMPALFNYLKKRGVDTNGMQNLPVGDIAGHVLVERMAQIGEKIGEMETAQRNNSPVIDNKGADIRIADIGGAPGDNTGGAYNTGIAGGLGNDYGDATALNQADPGDITRGVSIGLKKLESGEPGFSFDDGLFLYWGSGLVHPDVAHEAIMEEELEQFGFDMNPDNFISPEMIGAVLKLGQQAVVKINDKREGKGKKPILKFVEPKPKGEEGEGRETTTTDIPIGKQLASDFVDDLTAIKKKEEIKKMLPWIIVGVVVLVVVVVLVARRR